MRVAEHNHGDPYASLTGAIPTLTDSHGLRIIIDASLNSINKSLIQTTCQIVCDIKPMSREMIWSLPNLQPLFAVTKQAGLDNVVWGVYGGVPARYIMALLKLGINLTYEDLTFENRQNIALLVCNEMCNEIYNGIRLVLGAKAAHPAMQEIISLFNGSSEGHLEESILDENWFQRPTPDKVFRLDQRDGMPVLVPALNVIGIVLRHNLTKKPTVDELQMMIK